VRAPSVDGVLARVRWAGAPIARSRAPARLSSARRVTRSVRVEGPGNILGITRADTLVLLAVSIPVLLAHVVFYKEFLFVSFDREMARTMGYRVTFWNLFLYFTLGLVIAFAMQFAGVMLVFNFLVLPGVTGLLLARSMAGIFTIAVLSAVVAAVVGFSLSVPFDLPSGPAIIACSAVLALLAWPMRLMQRRG
jgi:ABC-type Mn2+/Zn2+ transport system permease subunit